MMPGMAANPSIFERITLPKEEFDVAWLSWKMPKQNESLQDYAKRMCSDLPKESPVVLIGVSFGGVLVQEMSRFLNVSRLIIISSVKTHHELPARMKLARDSGIYKMLPTGLINYITEIEKLPVGNTVRKRIKLYKQYLSVNDKAYLDWSIEKILCWKQEHILDGIIHIHGEDDAVFPIKNIKDCIRIPKGTHIMILNKYKWFNENLPQLIQKGLTKKSL
jgi:hypothetical protein